MPLRVGIIGLPNVGKSTLFNALNQALRADSGQALAPVANYPFTTIEPNVGVVPLLDDRLDAVARAMRSKKTTPAAIELVDIAGLVKGAHTGAGLGNEFLSYIRAVDALVHVVRGFDGGVERAGSMSPAEDIEVIRAELTAKDAEIAARRRDKERGTGNAEQLSLLAAKPVLTVFNVGEDLKVPPEAARFQPAVALSAKIEADLAELDHVDQPAFRAAYGLEKPRVSEVIRGIVQLLDLVTFFTANENEARAWIVPRGTTAVEAAGRVHTDFAEKFIRAESVAWADLVAAGSWRAARERGQVREEGRDAVIREGEVILFRIAP